MKHNALKYAAQKLNSSESERLHSLKEYDFSDNCIDESLDILTEMAQKVTQCSVAAISFLHSDKLYFKSITGFDREFLQSGNVPCEIAITKSDVYEIQDLSKHPRLKLNQLIKDGKILKYYAGVPLVNKDGYAIGTICVLDLKPQKLGTDKIEMLRLLGRKAMATIELHRKERLSREALEAKSEKLINGHIDLAKQSRRLERAQRSINSKELLLQGILDNSPHLVSLINHKGYYINVNKAVANFLGLPVDAIVGKHTSDIHKDKKRGEINAAIMRLVLDNKQTSRPFEEKLVVDGVTNYYQVVMIPVEDGAGQTIVLQIATNVTQLKTLELTVNRKNTELESLIYSLSHDLRGPISSILGLLNMEGHASEVEMRQYLKMIKDQTLRMDTTIHDLVELKNVTNKGILPQQVDIVQMINKLTSNLENCKADINHEHPEVVLINTDEYFLQIALNRVLTNAVSFHSRDAKSPKVEVITQEQTEGVLVTIKDNGLGISKKALPRIFDMFFRGTSASAGHGLGLYIAQNALAKVKASITLNSTEGLGTEVKIFIPRIEGQAYFD